TRLSGVRIAPVLIVVTMIVTGVAGAKISELGFRWLQPASIITDEIAKDPTSPVALAYTIAQKNGTPPGRTGGVLHVFALLPAAVMAVVDARPRPGGAAPRYAPAPFALWADRLSPPPALAPPAARGVGDS